MDPDLFRILDDFANHQRGDYCLTLTDCYGRTSIYHSGMTQVASVVDQLIPGSMVYPPLQVGKNSSSSHYHPQLEVPPAAYIKTMPMSWSQPLTHFSNNFFHSTNKRLADNLPQTPVSARSKRVRFQNDPKITANERPSVATLLRTDKPAHQGSPPGLVTPRRDSGSRNGVEPRSPPLTPTPTSSKPREIVIDNGLHFIEHEFRSLNQLVARHLATEWVRLREPAKRTLYPYMGGEETKPSWWPEDVRHAGPHHLLREERAKLLTALLSELRHQRDALVQSITMIATGERAAALKQLVFQLIEMLDSTDPVKQTPDTIDPSYLDIPCDKV